MSDAQAEYYTSNMGRRRTFSPRWNEVKRMAIRLLAEILLPYRNPNGYRHRIVTSLYLRLLAETEYADPRLVEELQLIRLKKMLKAAVKVPWWRAHFKKANLDIHVSQLKDIERLPPVTKHSFAGVPRARLLARFRLGHPRLFLHRTSGTTGVPFEWGVDKNALLAEIASYLHRAFSWYGVSARQDGRNPFIGAFVYYSYSAPGIGLWWNPAAPDEVEQFRSMLRAIHEKGLRVLFSYPTNVLLFAKKLEELGERNPFEAVFATGQRLDDEHRDYIQSVLGCPVVNLYGAREFGQMAIECPGHRHWYHINTERLLLEITDEAGKRLPDGAEGLITITSLENYMMPLIRYQLGDRGRIVRERCPCGRTLPVLEFFGKDMEFIRLPSGALVPFRHINLLVLTQFFYDIELYQIAQMAPDRLVMRLKLARGTSAHFESTFLEKLRRYIGTDIAVSFEYSLGGDLTAGRKAKIFLPLAGEAGEVVH